MTTQAEMRATMLNIQAKIQVHGVAKIETKKPAQLHQSLYKAMRRRGWRMYLKHDDQSVFVSLRSFK